MTPARKQALQWFHVRGEVKLFDATSPTSAMVRLLIKDGLLERVAPEGGGIGWMRHRLTDAGRQALHEAGR